ncbi:organic cation transporter protein-like isoform X1 [Maniola jurtina]|uniref:organic cation transporter protein-like isoform X1 n=1 Tax=Maniola jurtina TaxID=191418 RepID=UPI001E68D95D|nr:organic cation transporter protein-like isoform X1 [Maniola jurtina]XP_045769129.1 organic cation transporter protein-like isoform X1 [Maniola jurtina]
MGNEEKASTEKAGHVDTDALMQELGQFRKFHVLNYCLLGVVPFVLAHYAINYVFLAADVDYRCVVPECESANSTVYSPSWLQGALGGGARERRCSSKAPVDAELPCEAGAFSEQLRPCDHWLYASSDTIVAEFDMACQEWKRTLVGTIHNVGMLVSLPIIGYISDRWGRKRALVLSCTLVGAIGSLKAFSVSYEMYVVVEFLETVAGASAFPAAYILTIELLGQDKRVLTTAFLGIMLVIGGLSFALLAKAFPYFRTFILVAYPPSLLFLSYIYFLPESIRWLLSKGRREEALEIVLKAAKMNNVTLSDETMRQLTTVEEKVKIDDKKESVEEGGLWVQVLRSPIIMTRLAICSWWWITCTFVFYGLAINSVSLAGDKYTNYMLVVSVEVIAVVTNALVLDRIGRKTTLLIAYLVCGFSCVAIAFVPTAMSWLTTLLYLVGKVAITQAFSGIYMYTSELFPTHARHSLLGFCSMVGRVGSIVAPQMPLLAIYIEWLPSVLFGATALVAGGLMLTTPETLNTRLPDTIKEAECIAAQPRDNKQHSSSGVIPDAQATSKF